MQDKSRLYEELFQLFDDQRRAMMDHCLSLMNMASRFRARTHDVLGFPEPSFTALSSDEDMPWVRLYEHREGESPKPYSGGLMDSFQNDGSLSFAIGIALSSKLNSFPKNYFWVGYLLSKSKEGHLLSEIGGQKRSYHIHDDSDGDFDPAIQNFIRELRSVLDPSKPSQQQGSESRIGFMADI